MGSKWEQVSFQLSTFDALISKLTVVCICIAYISLGIFNGVSGHKLGILTVDNLLITAPKAYETYVSSVAVGAREGMVECRYQFKWEKWNCPLVKPPTLTADTLIPATRELAFARAVSSAGVTYRLTRNCSSGLLENCDCSNRHKPALPDAKHWTYGGCQESFHFAQQVSRVFVDGKEDSRDARAYVNLHNNEAGRQAVRRTMSLLCKCHGVSGACTTKTCWKQLPDFRDVGNYLKSKYRRALLADFVNGLPPREVVAYKYHGKKAAGISAIAIKTGELKKTSLVYLDPSPDYCRKNKSHATLGRQCVRSHDLESGSHAQKRSCNTLCRQCGLRVRKTSVQVQTSCDCKFHWCCSVKCRTCTETRNILTCSLL